MRVFSLDGVKPGGSLRNCDCFTRRISFGTLSQIHERKLLWSSHAIFKISVSVPKAGLDAGAADCKSAIQSRGVGTNLRYYAEPSLHNCSYIQFNGIGCKKDFCCGTLNPKFSSLCRALARVSFNSWPP